ncbi:hypothetical protein EJB05_30564, partial [Eragrostis curvula]
MVRLVSIGCCCELGTEEEDCADKKNLVSSPMSIYAALVAAGAWGETLDKFLTPARRCIAQRVRRVRKRRGGVRPRRPIWIGRVTRGLRVRRLARSKYEEAREEINSWVFKATNELITSILPKDSVHSKTALVLANCIYFKGKWSKPFATEDTKDRPFYRHDGTHVSAPLMKSRKDQFVNWLKVLKLPYVNSRDDDRRNWRKSVATSQNSDDDDDECTTILLHSSWWRRCLVQ